MTPVLGQQPGDPCAGGAARAQTVLQRTQTRAGWAWRGLVGQAGAPASAGGFSQVTPVINKGSPFLSPYAMLTLEPLDGRQHTVLSGATRLCRHCIKPLQDCGSLQPGSRPPWLHVNFDQGHVLGPKEVRNEHGRT